LLHVRLGFGGFEADQAAGLVQRISHRCSGAERLVGVHGGVGLLARGFRSVFKKLRKFNACFIDK
jgi:hypothetical protein